MKKLFFLLFTLPCYPVHGQKTKGKTEQNKIFIGVNFSPDYDFRTLKQNGGSSSGGLVINVRNDIEIPKFGYTTGLNICFHLSDIFKLETGIQYSNKGYQTKNYDVVFAPPNPSQPIKAKFIYSYRYIGVPLSLKLTAGKSKLRFLSSAGFLTNFLLKVKETYILEYLDGKTDINTQSLTDFQKVDISPMISLGIEYKINEKTHLTAEPTFRYGLIKTKDASITEHLWSAGLNIGFYYRLK